MAGTRASNSTTPAFGFALCLAVAAIANLVSAVDIELISNLEGTSAGPTSAAASVTQRFQVGPVDVSFSRAVVAVTGGSVTGASLRYDISGADQTVALTPETDGASLGAPVVLPAGSEAEITFDSSGSDLVLETTTDSGTGAGTLAFDVVVGSSAVIGRRAVIRVLVVAEVCTNSLAGSPLNSGAASFIGDNNVVFDSSNSEIDVVISIPNANGRYVGAINVGAELFQVGSCQFPVSAATCAVGNSELGFSLPYASALDASCYDSLETGIVDARYNGGVAGAASEIARYTYVGTLTYPERIVTTRNGVDYEGTRIVTDSFVFYVEAATQIEVETTATIYAAPEFSVLLQSFELAVTSASIDASSPTGDEVTYDVSLTLWMRVQDPFEVHSMENTGGPTGVAAVNPTSPSETAGNPPTGYNDQIFAFNFQVPTGVACTLDTQTFAFAWKVQCASATDCPLSASDAAEMAGTISMEVPVVVGSLCPVVSSGFVEFDAEATIYEYDTACTTTEIDTAFPAATVCFGIEADPGMSGVPLESALIARIFTNDGGEVVAAGPYTDDAPGTTSDTHVVDLGTMGITGDTATFYIEVEATYATARRRSLLATDTTLVSASLTMRSAPGTGALNAGSAADREALLNPIGLVAVVVLVAGGLVAVVAILVWVRHKNRQTQRALEAATADFKNRTLPQVASTTSAVGASSPHATLSSLSSSLSSSSSSEASSGASTGVATSSVSVV